MSRTRRPPGRPAEGERLNPHAPRAIPPAGPLRTPSPLPAGSGWARLVVLLSFSLVSMAAMAPAAAAPATGSVRQGEQVFSWGRMEVSASPELVFAVLTDYDHMADFLPGMRTSEVVSRSGHSVVIEQTADEAVLFFSQRVIVRLAIDESPPDRLTLRSLAGSFKQLDGSYELTRMAEGTLIEYRSRFVPDFPFPPIVGTYAVERSLARHLAALAQEMQRRSSQAPPSRMQ